MSEYEFTVVIDQDEDGRFVAICPDLQGCYTEGETKEEVRSLIMPPLDPAHPVGSSGVPRQALPHQPPALANPAGSAPERVRPACAHR